MVVSSSIFFVGTDLQIVYGQCQCMFIQYQLILGLKTSNSIEKSGCNLFLLISIIALIKVNLFPQVTVKTSNGMEECEICFLNMPSAVSMEHPSCGSVL